MSYRSKYKIENSIMFAPTHAHIYCELETREGTAGQIGLFTTEFIKQGTVIAQDGGNIVTSIEDKVPGKSYVVLVGEGLWLAPRDYDDMETLCFLNHSCNSNVSRIGSLTFIAKKDIQSGEELTIDYAPLVSGYEGWTLNCECGSANCRKIITSHDHLVPELAESLWSEWLPFIQKFLTKNRIL